MVLEMYSAGKNVRVQLLLISVAIMRGRGREGGLGGGGGGIRHVVIISRQTSGT